MDFPKPLPFKNAIDTYQNQPLLHDILQKTLKILEKEDMHPLSDKTKTIFGYNYNTIGYYNQDIGQTLIVLDGENGFDLSNSKNPATMRFQAVSSEMVVLSLHSIGSGAYIETGLEETEANNLTIKGLFDEAKLEQFMHVYLHPQNRLRSSTQHELKM